MKRRILCLLLVFVSLISIVFSSFSVYADDFDINDYIEVHKPEIPKVDSNGDLLQDDIDTSFNDEFYNSPDEIDEDEKDEKTFDKKQYYSADDNTSSSNINSDVDSNKSSTVTKKSLSKSPRASSLNEENGISAQSDDDSYIDPAIPSNWDGKHSGTSFVVTPENALACFLNGFNAIADLPQYKFDFNGDVLYNSYLELFNQNNLIIYRYIDPYKVYNSDYHEYYYGFIFTDSDLHFTSVNPGVSKFDATYCNFASSPNLSQGNIFSAVIACSANKLGYDSFNFQFSDIDYKYYGGNTFYCGENTDFSIVYNGGSHNIFIDNEKVSSSSSSEILGNILIDDNAVDLYWQAKSSNDITDDTVYDVKLFALDIDNSESVPSSLFDDIRYCDLSKFYSCDGTIDKDHQFIYDSADLEHIYYYIHQMKAYDDSEESVTGYDFDKFEIRNTCTFVVAFKLKDSNENYIICKDSIFVYNYENTIDEVMSDFSVRKDYEDFPDIKDYINDYPDVEDFYPEDGGVLGPIDWILAYVKWIGACLKTFGKNFLGFFRWLKDCTSVLWNNLSIFGYNLVCDLKSLLLYLFKPKTKSINTMVNKKIPGFINLKNSFNNTNKAKLPYFKLFGTKFGFDFSVIDSDTKSFLRTISSVLIYIVFAVGVLKLIGKVFGFNIHGGSDDSDEG